MLGDPQSGADRAAAALQRDAALQRIVRTRRWLLAGAAALTAELTALASALLPGKSLGAKSRTPAVTKTTPAKRALATSGAPALPPPAGAAALGLQGGESGQSSPESDNSGSGNSGSQAAQPPPAPAPQPAPSAGGSGGGVVSGGS